MLLVLLAKIRIFMNYAIKTWINLIKKFADILFNIQK